MPALSLIATAGEAKRKAIGRIFERTATGIRDEEYVIAKSLITRLKELSGADAKIEAGSTFCRVCALQN
jgi:hypothetical protein